MKRTSILRHQSHSSFTRHTAWFLVWGQVFLAVPMASAKDKPSGKDKPAAKNVAPPSAAPAPPKVKVNRTVPKVSPPAVMPQFSAKPTDAEIFRAHIFDEPLVPIGATTNQAENNALADAIRSYAAGGEREQVDAFDAF